MYFICGCLHACYTKKKFRFPTNILLMQSGSIFISIIYLDTSPLILRQFSTIKSVISRIEQVYLSVYIYFLKFKLGSSTRVCIFLLSVTKIETVCFKKTKIHELNELTQIKILKRTCQNFCPLSIYQIEQVF